MDPDFTQRYCFINRFGRVAHTPPAVLIDNSAAIDIERFAHRTLPPKRFEETYSLLCHLQSSDIDVATYQAARECAFGGNPWSSGHRERGTDLLNVVLTVLQWPRARLVEL